jgi:hypothetical protein
MVARGDLAMVRQMRCFDVQHVGGTCYSDLRSRFFRLLLVVVRQSD